MALHSKQGFLSAFRGLLFLILVLVALGVAANLFLGPTTTTSVPATSSVGSTISSPTTTKSKSSSLMLNPSTTTSHPQISSTRSTTSEPSYSWDCSTKWTGNRTGRVTAILDGDTIEVEGCRVRLSLVDAPEMGFPGSEDARNFLATLIPVGTLVIVDQDRGQPFDSYGRIVGVVYRDGINVNAELLKKGKARLFTRYCSVSEFSESAWAVKFGCGSKSTTSSLASRTITPTPIESTSSTTKTTTSTTSSESTRSYMGCIRVITFHYNAAGNDNKNLNDEYVTLMNTCDFPIDMSGWRITDSGSKHVYRFKTFTLNPGATVTIHSGRGVDTATDLYWGRSYGAIWNNDGDTLYLYDDNGRLVLVYRY